jgi:hypothetical protein
MRWLMLLLLLSVVNAAEAAGAHVYKVLPQFLDEQGRDSLTPSLYDRDSYQSFLTHHPDKRSGMRFAVEWNAAVTQTNEWKLRVELRGVPEGKRAKATTLELPLAPHKGFRRWDYMLFKGDDYKAFGEVTAWRVTLWDGDQQLDEQKSFLW